MFVLIKTDKRLLRLQSQLSNTRLKQFIVLTLQSLVSENRLNLNCEISTYLPIEEGTEMNISGMGTKALHFDAWILHSGSKGQVVY